MRIQSAFPLQFPSQDLHIFLRRFSSIMSYRSHSHHRIENETKINLVLVVFIDSYSLTLTRTQCICLDVPFQTKGPMTEQVSAVIVSLKWVSFTFLFHLQWTESLTTTTSALHTLGNARNRCWVFAHQHRFRIPHISQWWVWCQTETSAHPSAKYWTSKLYLSFLLGFDWITHCNGISNSSTPPTWLAIGVLSSTNDLAVRVRHFERKKSHSR